jgi:serine/threonine protein kinase/Flp pilus assembly protein TadD
LWTATVGAQVYWCPHLLPEPPVSDSSADRDPLERLAEEFVTRFRAGERPALTEFAERHPELADQIRDLFPALVEMEQLKPATGERTGPYSTEPQHLEHIAGFRILREIGRGGMGVVYEAVQTSLNRRVALKVLPDHSVRDEKRRERFRREARAAARLHHTNIVPVFQTGEADGVHFYAMQFIAGCGLDQMVIELRRLREGGSGAPAPVPGSEMNGAGSESPPAHIARALATNSFGPRPASGTRTFVPDPEPRAPTATATAAPDAPHPAVPAPSALAGSTTTPESAFSSGSGRRYWESVARIGVQAAGALAHAHALGVLHRDIKPSNLLLDAHGTLWVADFGLAKVAEDEDLTGTGDVLGTLRYMAPERFEGECDARADVYALGLTLYELLTLKPAFNGSGREKLIARVTQGQPERPSKLNPDVPRDLETIVLKASAREPDARYQTAAEMADDLECFLQDRPIRARRASTVHRFVRWSRRNPVVSGLTVALALVLTVVAAGSTVGMLSYRALAESETKARGAVEDEKLKVEAEAQKLIDDRDRQKRANARFESGLRHSLQKEWAEALADYTLAIELKPDNSQVWSDRGGLYLRLGLAPEAAADFAKLFELREPDDPSWWVFRAALQLYVGDRAGYRSTCRAMRRHFPDANSPDLVCAIVQACTLAPDGCDDKAELVRLVDGGIERFPTETFGELLIAAIFRAERYQDVVLATTTPTGAAGVGTERAQRPAVLCYRAMSLARLNNDPAAKVALTTARDKLDASATLLSAQPFGPSVGGRFVGTFPPAVRQEETIDWVIDDLIWREAGGGIAPDTGAHPLPQLVRARGCAAVGRWYDADAATDKAVRLTPADPKPHRLTAVVLLERMRLNAARGNWSEVAVDSAAAIGATQSPDALHQQVIALYAAHGRHDDARRQLSDRIAALEKTGLGLPLLLALKQERARSNIQSKNWDSAASDLAGVLAGLALMSNDPRTRPVVPTLYNNTIGGGWGGEFYDPYFPRLSKATWGAGFSTHFPLGTAGAGPGGPGATGQGNPLAELRREIVRHDELYTRVIALRPNDTDLRRERGRYLADAKRWDDAKTFYLDWLENPPKPLGFEPPAQPSVTQADLRRRNLFAILKDDLAQCDQVFEAVTAKYPDVVVLWDTRFYWLVRAKDYDRAADAILHTLPAVSSPKGTYVPEAYGPVVTNDEVFQRVVAKRPTDGVLWMARFRATVNQPGEKGMRAAVEVVKHCDQPLWMRQVAVSLAYVKEPESAVPFFAEMLNVRPNDPEVRMGHCLLLVRLKKWDEAVAEFDAALKAVPAPTAVPADTTVQSLYSALPFDETTYTEFTRLRPDDARLVMMRARQIASSGKDAILLFDKATKMAPKDPEMWLELGRACTKQRQWKESAAAYDKHLALVPALPLWRANTPNATTPLAYAEIIRGGLVNGPYGTTRPLLDEVLVLRPNDAYLRLALCRALRGPPIPGTPALRAELDAAFEALLKIAPKEPVAWIERAQYRLSTGTVDKAVEDFAAAGKLFPQNLWDKDHGQAMHAMYSLFANNPQLFAAYTKTAPDDPFPWLFRGWQRCNPLHPQHAMWYADVTHAIEIRPDDPLFRHERVWCLLNLGLWDRAAVECYAEIARAGAKTDDMIWMMGGCALAANGDLKRYREFCRRMAEAWGELDTPVRKHRFVMTQLLYPNPALDARKMVEYARAGFDADPKAWWNTFTLELARVRAGDPGKAADAIRAYLKNPDKTYWGTQDRLALRFLLAVALAKSGERDEARKVFEESCKEMDSELYPPPRDKRKLSYSGHVWGACEALRREADGLINNGAPAPHTVGERPK